MGPVLLDIRYTPHLMIGGATNSGKSVTLKLLLHQCAMHGMKVTIADFKGGVDFCAPWWRDNVRLVYDLDGLVQLLDTFMEALNERKKLFREAGCSDIEQYIAKTDKAQIPCSTAPCNRLWRWAISVSIPPMPVYCPAW